MVCFNGPPIQWLWAAFLAGLAVAVARRRGWLTPDGQLAAWLLGFWIFGRGGWTWSLPAVFFFASSSLSTLWKASPGGRNARQVLANGLGPALMLALCSVLGLRRAWLGYNAFLAAATADTWASEWGRRIPSATWSLRTGKPVPPGAPAAASLMGALAAMLGAGSMGLLAAFFFPQARLTIFLRVALAGWLAVWVDSFLGAWVQGRFRCTTCGAEVEAGEPHPHTSLERVTGLSWFTNDLVNLLANLSAILLAWILPF